MARRTRHFLLIACVCSLMFAAATGFAQPTWPATDALWTPLDEPCADPSHSPTGLYLEPHGDFPGATGGQHWVDIVGDPTQAPLGVPLAAGFAATDGTYLMLRMRVDKIVGAPQFVWQWLFDLDGDFNVDWSLQLDDKVDNAVEFIPATPGSPLFHQVNLSHTAGDGHWFALVGTGYDRFILDTLDVDLGDTPDNDSFVDVGIPWSEFTTRTGESAWNGLGSFPWKLFLTSSNSHIQVNKDTPYPCVGPSADQVPEPASLTLLGLGAAALLASRRRRRR